MYANQGSSAAQSWAQKRKEQMERAKAIKEERKHPVANSEAPSNANRGRKTTWAEPEPAPEPAPSYNYAPNPHEDRPIQSQYASRQTNPAPTNANANTYSNTNTNTNTNSNFRSNQNESNGYKRASSPMQERHGYGGDRDEHAYATGSYGTAQANASRSTRNPEPKQPQQPQPSYSAQTYGNANSSAYAPASNSARGQPNRPTPSVSSNTRSNYAAAPSDETHVIESSIDEDLSISDIRKMSNELCKELLMFLLEHHYSLMKTVMKFFAGKGESNPKRFILMSQKEADSKAAKSAPVTASVKGTKPAPVPSPTFRSYPDDDDDDSQDLSSKPRTKGSTATSAYNQNAYQTSSRDSHRGQQQQQYEYEEQYQPETIDSNRNRQRPPEARRGQDSNMSSQNSDSSQRSNPERDSSRTKPPGQAQPILQRSNSQKQIPGATQQRAPSPSPSPSQRQQMQDTKYKAQYYQYAQPYQSADQGDEEDESEQGAFQPSYPPQTRNTANVKSNQPPTPNRNVQQKTNTRQEEAYRPSSRASQRSQPEPQQYEDEYENNEDEEEQDPYAGGNTDTTECQICGRKFATDRIKVHQRICNKVSTKERKVFDSTKHRLEGEAAQMYKSAQRREQKAAKSAPEGKGDLPAKIPKWKRDHMAFINAIRSAKGQAPMTISDPSLPAGASVPVDDGLQACPHCGRKFNENAADRHIPICAKLNMKAKPGAGSAANAAQLGSTSQRQPTREAPANASLNKQTSKGNLASTTSATAAKPGGARPSMTSSYRPR